MQRIICTIFFCLCFSVAALAAPAEPAKQAKPTQTGQPAEPAKTVETVAKVEPEKPAVPVKEPFTVLAKRGMIGPPVDAVQLMLADGGHYNGAIDGAFGVGTEQAVKSFQAQIGVPQDGIVTEDLMNMLKHYSKRAASELPSRYSKVIQMEATAYTTEDPGCGLYTFRGSRLRKGLVAVDPNFIPLGTRLYVVGYGPALADDTGGDIKGNRIDLAYESRPEAFKFGRRMVTVYILD